MIPIIIVIAVVIWISIVVSNFIIQALQNKDITIYGDGSNTRSFQYVSDLVRGLVLLMNSEYDAPCNIGNPDEYSIKAFAEQVKSMTESQSKIVYLPKVTDDPTQRQARSSADRHRICPYHRRHKPRRSAAPAPPAL